MDNRSIVLNTALVLFSTRGYDAVGVQEVVDTAGVTKPTLYHYFTNKYGLLEAVLEYGFKDLLADLRSAAQYEHNLIMNLRGVAQVYFRFAQKNPAFYRLQLTMQYASPDSEPNRGVSRYAAEQQRILEELFQLATVDHGNMKDRQHAYAATFQGMINTYVGMYLNGHIELTDELVYRAVHQFMHGIFS